MRHILAVLTLALLAAWPAAAELTLQTVSSDKVFYDPGQEAKFTVVVANPDAAAASASLRVELVSDVATVTALGEQAVTVASQGQSTWTGKATMQPVLGMALRAVLLRDGQPLAAQSDYFSCARSVHQVLQFGVGNHGAWQFSGQIDKIRDTYPRQFAGEVRGNYGNCAEKFGWAPSDFDDMTPSYDRWWAGQTGYNECKPNMVAVINAMHEQGVKVVTYGKQAGGGNVGLETLRRRPDEGMYSNGRYAGDSYDAAALDFYTALGPPHEGEPRPVPGSPEEMEKSGYPGVAWYAPFTPGAQSWADIWWDCSNPWVAELGIGELVGSAKMFGFDGVRFDGEFWAARSQRLDGSWSQPEKVDLEAANLALVRQMKQECWAYNPQYLFGYNAGTTITWSIPAGNIPAQFQEKCKDDGLIADESFAFPSDIPWTLYCARVRAAQEIVHHYGGHYATYAFNRSGNNLYNYLGQYALRSHQMVSYSGPGNEWLNRSATRFARLLWDDSLTTWRGAGEALKISGSRPVWWQEFAAVGDSPEGGARYVIHLINPPESPTTFGKELLPAEPATNVVVRWAGLKGLRQAWVVDMPSATAEEIKPQNGAFDVGDLAYWKILVVDVTTPKPPVTWEPPPAGGTASGPSATDLQIAPPVTPGGDSWRTVVEPERWGGGEDVAQRLPDPTASAGGAVMGKPGGKTGSMAYSYEYPRIPGRYRCTYRLKVADNKVDAPVFQLSTSYSQGAPFPGVVPPTGENKTLKATDFAKPNVYETFTTEFDYADYGFMGCSVNYLGNVQGWWDNLTIDLIRPWTDQQLADFYKNFQRPEGLTKADNATFDVLVVRGLFNREYQIDAATKALEAKQVDAYTAYHQQRGTTLQGYQWDWKQIWDLDVVVLADVETKGLNYGQVLMLSEWVKDGGGLLILGGPLTLGQDDNMKRAWPLLLPVDLKGPWEIRKCEPPLKIAGFAEPAAVMYRHMVTPKADAAVLLKGAGGEPLLVGKGYGKGRVAVFTGTVLGEPPAGAKGFWQTDQWKQELGKAIGWVAGKWSLRG